MYNWKASKSTPASQLGGHCLRCNTGYTVTPGKAQRLVGFQHFVKHLELSYVDHEQNNLAVLTVYFKLCEASKTSLMTSNRSRQDL